MHLITSGQLILTDVITSGSRANQFREGYGRATYKTYGKVDENKMHNGYIWPFHRYNAEVRFDQLDGMHYVAKDESSFRMLSRMEVARHDDHILLMHKKTESQKNRRQIFI